MLYGEMLDWLLNGASTQTLLLLLFYFASMKCKNSAFTFNTIEQNRTENKNKNKKINITRLLRSTYTLNKIIDQFAAEVRYFDQMVSSHY